MMLYYNKKVSIHKVYGYIIIIMRNPIEAKEYYNNVFNKVRLFKP